MDPVRTPYEELNGDQLAVDLPRLTARQAMQDLIQGVPGSAVRPYRP